MPNEYKMTPQGRIELTDEEQAALEASRAAQAVIDAELAAKEAARLARRPKRSAINTTVANVTNATTVPELRAAVTELAQLMDDVLAFQQVDVDEDV